ncbi:protoporphyrinogen/coproporphyrinogen oxidase [Frigoribacterium faeni]|uniref:protoporphyrinogen/coproporphyrinogen oxidase n=1 Tax=Frigoribacterium faeni TaxID=145483 RepID=UPI0032650BEA|nr:oxygen-dependent protoporphyrinogen oxidase [Frigoribacterium faeni]
MTEATRSSGAATRRALVVGGGVAGLVVARDLASAGVDVVLVEASDRLGGEVGRHVVGGLPLDAGAESFATRGGTVRAYLDELGLGDDVVLPDPRGAWVQHGSGQAFPLPRTGLLGIPGDLAADDVVAVVGAAGTAEAARLDAAPGDVGADETSVGGLVRVRMGDAVLDRLVTPIIGGVHSVHPDALSVDRVAPGLRAALRREGSLAAAVLSVRALAPAGSAVAGLRGGMASLAEALVAELDRLGVEVRLGAHVAALDGRSVTLNGDAAAAGQGAAATSSTSGAPERLEADVVVLAVGDGAGRVLTGRAAHAAGLITLATLVLRDPRLDAAPRGTGVLVAPGADGVRAKALTHATAKWPWLAERAAGRHVLRLSYDSPAVTGATTDDELRSTALADASVLLGLTLDPATVEDAARVEWSAPLPQEAAGASSSLPDGVVRVGGAVAGRGLAAVIAHARRVAAELVAR